jgi:hypothetical protein
MSEAQPASARSWQGLTESRELMILARPDVNAEDAKGRLNGGRSSDHMRVSALNVAT